MRPARTLVVWCQDWPVTAAGFPADEPVVVIKANRVESCSAAARGAGVSIGMRKREAQRACDGMITVDWDDARDARVFEVIAAAVEKFGPAVEILQTGACAIPTRGPSRYFGGDHALAMKVLASVGEIAGNLGATCQVGIADGPFAALLAAKHSLVVDPGETAGFLRPLPVHVLEARELTSLLVRLGIKTLGDFAKLREADVLARFGPEGAAQHRLALGLDRRPLAPRKPPVDLSVVHHFDPPVDRIDVAAFATRALAATLIEKVRASGYTCTRVEMDAQTENGEQLVRQWRFEEAIDDAMLGERCRWQLEGWLTNTSSDDRPTSGISSIRLTPDQFTLAQGVQKGLWDAGGEADERARRGFLRVQGLLGPEAVLVPTVVGGRHPRDCVQVVPWGEQGEQGERGEQGEKRKRGKAGLTSGTKSLRVIDDKAPWPNRIPSPSPAIVFAERDVVEVLDHSSCAVSVSSRGTCSAMPARIILSDGRSRKISAWTGPWTADEQWWDAAGQRRRATMQLVDEAGVAYLVSRESGQWLLDAIYD